MEIIALRGPQNSGKTTTLKMVYDKLLEQGFLQQDSASQELSNGDFLAILENDGKQVGIVTQGDYARGECSVKNHLRTLENLGYGYLCLHNRLRQRRYSSRYQCLPYARLR